jgi:thioredoxin 1
MLVIKRYTASWCGPCQMLSPIMAELQNENSNVSFITVDVDQNAEEAKISNVRGVPTVMFLKDGQEVHRFSGVQPKQVIANLIKQYS